MIKESGELERKLQLHNLKLSVSYGKEHGAFNHERWNSH